MDALKIDNLYKSFGNHIVLNGLSLSIPEKTIFGFLGKELMRGVLKSLEKK